MLGRPVYNRKLDVQSEADYSISTVDLKAGVYYLQVLGDNGYAKVIRFANSRVIRDLQSSTSLPSDL